MQSITPVTIDQLLASGQQLKVKVEIYVGAAWVNLCDLDSKNYIEDWSISLGGASMTPAPIAGTFSLVLSNENGIFHPKHPTSAYKDYIKVGRKTRISIGGKYGGTDYYWQRIIGHMDEPNFDIANAKISVSGFDYMRFLQDTELKSPDNYWGSSQAFDSWPSDGLVGNEIYNEVDAMDINNEANNVTNWTPVTCSFASYADTGGGSNYVGRLTSVTDLYAHVKNTNVGSVTAGKEYRVKIKHRGVGEDGTYYIRVQIRQSSGICKTKMYFPTDDWAEESLYFTALDTGAIEMRIYCTPNISDLRVDQISIFEFVPYTKRYYELPSESKGAYYVTLDGNPVWQGEEDDGWYEEDGTRRVFFDINKTVSAGTNNVVIYYYTTTAIEDILADLLVTAGLYTDRASAKADMNYTDPAVDINQPWFEAGTSALDAVNKICERCDYRFFFNYDGKPDFNPEPSGATVFTFTNQKHIASPKRYEDREEIKNRIVIEGKRQAEPVSRDETIPPKLRGEASDATSITNYGERTLTIDNFLFQTQASIDSMCTSLLAKRKDPKWYVDFDSEKNPVPLEMADKIAWKERLSPSLEISDSGYIRDIKISKFNATYRNETV